MNFPMACGMDNSTLRDRRRLQTARDIQRSALVLAVRHGHDRLTTEMIATHAGISQRTFFNYYLNKDAAIVGATPCLNDETVARFHAARGPLLADLLEALRDLSDHLDRDTARLIVRLMEVSPDLLPVFHGSLNRLRDQIADLAVARLGEAARPDAVLLAEAVVHALAGAIRAWATDDAMPRARVADLAAARLQTLRGLLAKV